MIGRRVVVVVPARNEGDRIQACLQRLSGLATDERVKSLSVVVFANNCRDDTAERTHQFAESAALPVVLEVADLPPEKANAGWARRLAFDGGLAFLSEPQDALLCTDADTLPAADWLLKTLNHLDAGYDAVAGFARFDPRELRRLDPAHRARLAAIRRYEDAYCYLKSLAPSDEPSLRHFYEGGASIAVTLDAYRAIGGAPTPPVGEDKALFEALRAKGRRIRHPKDVRVLTSCRLDGRAPAGAADTLARWMVQDGEESLWGLRPIAAALGGLCENAPPLTLDSLPAETERARALVRAARSRRSFAKVG